MPRRHTGPATWLRHFFGNVFGKPRDWPMAILKFLWRAFPWVMIAAVVSAALTGIFMAIASRHGGESDGKGFNATNGTLSGHGPHLMP